jgi:hypothetical protein
MKGPLLENLAELVNAEDLKWIIQQSNLKRSGELWSQRYNKIRGIHKDGHEIYLESTAVEITLQTGSAVLVHLHPIDREKWEMSEFLDS